MGWRSHSARPLQLLPFVCIALLAALGWTGLRARSAADVPAMPRPPGARPSSAPSLRVERALCFEPETVELGRLEPGTPLEASVTWRLEGSKPRRVLGVDATCGCVLAAGPRGELAPGDSGPLRLTIRPPRRSGPFRATVKVWLHPPGGGLPAQLVVRGHVLFPVGVRPERLALGRRATGSMTERLIEVELAPELVGAPVQAALEGLAGSVAVESSAFAERPGATLRLVVRVPVEPGPLAGRVVVRVEGVVGAVAVPLTGEAVVRR